LNEVGAALSLGALVVSASLGAYVLALGPRRSANRAFFLLMLVFVWWDASEAILRFMPTGSSAASLRPWLDAEWIGIAATPAALLHVALTYPQARPWLRLPWSLPLLYAPVLGWGLVIVFSDSLVSGLTMNAFGPSGLVGPGYPVLVVVYALWLAAGVFLFLRALWRLRRSEWWVRQAVVAIGLLATVIPAAITDMFWPIVSAGRTPLGLASAYTLLWSVFIAIAVLRYEYLTIEPVTETRVAPKARHPLRAGLNYLVVEPGRSAGLGAFREIVSTTPGLVITALPPVRLASRFGLERTPIVWVTMSEAGERTVRPQGLEFELVHTIVKFLRENRGTAVLLDDLDYLASVNGFESVARFLKRVANQASASGGTLIATVGRGTFSSEQLTVLTGSVDHILEVEDGPNGDASMRASVLIAPPADVPGQLSERGVASGLVLTTEHPTKARRRYGDAFSMLWITEHPEGDATAVRPKDLDTEGKRALANFLAAHPGADVMIEGLDQLALFLDFRTLLTFLKDCVDSTTVRGGRAFASVSPGGLPADQVARVVRRFDMPAGASVFRSFPPGARATAAPGSRTPTRGPAS
jgi:uncharacterized protein DUF835/histidine kinase-like protein